jgi:hypothetical protein
MRERKETDFLLEPPEDHGPAATLILVSSWFWIYNFQNYKDTSALF